VAIPRARGPHPQHRLRCDGRTGSLIWTHLLRLPGCRRAVGLDLDSQGVSDRRLTHDSLWRWAR
jgi:hypothetical protein